MNLALESSELASFPLGFYYPISHVLACYGPLASPK